MANSSFDSHLTHALNVYNRAPARWAGHENYSNVAQAADATPHAENGIASNAKQPVSPHFEKLQLNTYHGDVPSIPRDPVSFLDEHQNPTMLHTLLSETVVREGWEHPWTDDETVKHKMNLRLELPGSVKEGVPERRASSLFYVLDHRPDQKPITKTRLGYNIAKALKECVELTAFCEWKGYEFDDLALYDLVNVSQGSWQPTLYVNKYGRPVRYSLYDPCSAFPGYTFE